MQWAHPPGLRLARPPFLPSNLAWSDFSVGSVLAWAGLAAYFAFKFPLLRFDRDCARQCVGVSPPAVGSTWARLLGPLLTGVTVWRSGGVVPGRSCRCTTDFFFFSLRNLVQSLREV
jgi:hypothetical protein